MITEDERMIVVELGRFIFALVAMFILGAVAETFLLKLAGVI